MALRGVWSTRGVFDNSASAGVWQIAATASVGIHGTKQSTDNTTINATYAIDLNGTKQVASNVNFSLLAEPSLNGVKHSSDNIHVSATAIFDWLGNSEDEGSGSIIIQTTPQLSFIGVKNATDQVNLVHPLTAIFKGLKASPGSFSSLPTYSLSHVGVKRSTDELNYLALIDLSFSGQSDQTPPISKRISIQGVRQSTHLVGILQTTSIKGYV